ncbi:MAG: 30S ribosomal protein S5 [Phycisphaerales bacterium]|nr:MAG: 30S ribosomal protein S5 [Phycisphaerales bacterium]
MAEMLDETAAIESTTVGVYRTAATVKGGRRFSFSALTVVGDRAGRVGMGYGKANQVPPAIEKAQKEARRRMKQYPLVGRTIPHAVTGRFGSCVVRLVPASPGTGVIAGAAVRAPLEMLGIQDCLTKSFGSNNSKNLVKAVIDGLEQLRAKGEVSELRGVEIATTSVEEAIKRGKAFMPTVTAPVEAPAEAPAKRDDRAKPGEKEQEGRRGGRHRGRGRGRGKGGPPRGEKKPQAAKSQGQESQAPRPEASAPDAPPKAEPEKAADTPSAGGNQSTPGGKDQES